MESALSKTRPHILGVCLRRVDYTEALRSQTGDISAFHARLHLYSSQTPSARGQRGKHKHARSHKSNPLTPPSPSSTYINGQQECKWKKDPVSQKATPQLALLTLCLHRPIAPNSLDVCFPAAPSNDHRRLVQLQFQYSIPGDVTWKPSLHLLSCDCPFYSRRVGDHVMLMQMTERLARFHRCRHACWLCTAASLGRCPALR